jgi:tetratricopeptide repeat protein 30
MAVPGTAIPGTSAGVFFSRGNGVVEGNYTATIYGLLREGKYGDAAHLLTQELSNFPRSRAALSLLGYSYYYMQDFRSAALTYEQLVRFHPDVDEYKIYYAQSLFKAGLYDEAGKACMRLDNEEYSQRLLKLQAAIRYEQDELAACKSLVDQCLPDDPDTLINQACITYKEGEFEKARVMFSDAMAILGYQPDIAYNIALCHYCLKQFGPALKFIAEIIEKGVREHPELSVGSNTDGIEVG